MQNLNYRRTINKLQKDAAAVGHKLGTCPIHEHKIIAALMLTIDTHIKSNNDDVMKNIINLKNITVNHFINEDILVYPTLKNISQPVRLDFTYL